MRIPTTFVAVMLLSCLQAAVPDDWPQWLGPKRDSVWREAGIVREFPDKGLPIKWRAPIQHGYAGPAVAGDRVFVMDYVVRTGKITNNPGGPDKLTGSERVLCFNASTGKLLWKHEYDRPYRMSFGSGPRCTPTVDGDRVYALGAQGNLWCLRTDNGHVIWSKDFVKDYRAESPLWGVASHPLVDGDLLYCVVGGKGSVAVAFEKKTGKEVWRSLSASQQGYCPPTMIQQGSKKQLLIWSADQLNGLDPATGKSFWSVPLKPNYGMSITTPRQDGDFLFASGYGSACVMLKLDPVQPAVGIAWRGTPKTGVYCCNSTPFLQDGIIYGCDLNTGALMAVQMSDGKRLWETLQPTSGGKRRARYATAFIVKNGDRFFLFNEKGDLIVAALSRKSYTEISRFHVLEPTNKTFDRTVVWSHPAFAHKSVFARNDKELVCVNLAADGK